MGPLPTVILLCIAGELQADAQVAATVTQRAGDLPNGAPGGGSILSYDSELRPELLLRLADRRFTASVRYDPRFLLRVQFPEGEGATALEADGRPFLVLHSLEGASQYLIAPRWSWSNTVQGLFGEQDFALFALQGVGAGDGGGGGLADAQVIDTASVNVVTTLVGPLVGHNDFRTSAWFNLSFPDADLAAGGMMPPEDPNDDGDPLCFGDNGADPTTLGGFFIADTCQFGLATATISPLSRVDRLEIEGRYEAIDFDPGPFVHAVSADIPWRRQFSRRLEGRVRGGAIFAIDADPLPGQQTVTPLPIVDLGLAWQLLNLRRLQLGLDLEVGADGFVEAVSRRYLLRGVATAGLSAVIRRDIRTALQFNVFMLGLDEACAPRQPLTDVRPAGCPDDLSDAERAAEIPDLSAFSTEFSLMWVLNPHVSLVGGARYAFRAPHISRIGETNEAIGGAPFGESQREISGQIGIRVTFGTRNDLGEPGAGLLGTEVMAAPAPAPAGETLPESDLDEEPEDGSDVTDDPTLEDEIEP